MPKYEIVCPECRVAEVREVGMWNKEIPVPQCTTCHGNLEIVAKPGMIKKSEVVDMMVELSDKFTIACRIIDNFLKDNEDA